MPITYSEQSDFAYHKVALGYITGFFVSDIGLVSFDKTSTGTGSLSAQTCLIRPKERVIVSPPIADGIMRLPGGRVFNPWGLAGKRAPVFYPTYTQTIVYHGHPELTMREFEVLLTRVGLTGVLYFSYGRIAADTFGTKRCNAIMLPSSATAQRVLNTSVTTSKTWIEFTASWQQTTDFTSG